MQHDKDKDPKCDKNTECDTCDTCDTDQCTVCMSKLNLPVKLICGHSFCFLCIKSTKLEAMSDKINCPLCREPIDINIEKLTLADIKVDSDTICLDDDISSAYPKIVWMYASNDITSWWYYDIETNKVIEELYQKYVNKSQADFQIHIGAKQYDLDFDNLSQHLSSDKAKKRPIKRLEITDESQENTFKKQHKVRGVAGVRF